MATMSTKRCKKKVHQHQDFPQLEDENDHHRDNNESANETREVAPSYRDSINETKMLMKESNKFMLGRDQKGFKLDDETSTGYVQSNKNKSEEDIFAYLDQIESQTNLEMDSATENGFSSNFFGGRMEDSHNQMSSNWMEPRLSSSPSGDSIRSFGSSTKSYNGIKSKLVAITLDLEDKVKTIRLMKEYQEKTKAKHEMQIQEMEETNKTKLLQQQKEYETAIERQLGFVDKLLMDKSDLAGKCESLALQLKKVEGEAAQSIGKVKEGSQRELKQAKELWAAQEKVRRDQWQTSKAKEIKQLTIKGLEPEIQGLLVKHREEIKKIQEAAKLDKNTTITMLQKEKEMALKEQQQEFERELGAVVQKERLKLSDRLGLANDESYDRMESLRRRMEQETEAIRTKLHNEKQQNEEIHAAELSKLRNLEQERIEKLIVKHNEEKEIMIRKHSEELSNWKEKLTMESNHWKEKVLEKMREEVVQEKHQIRQDLQKTRDEEIEMVIERLQTESRKHIENLELKYKKKMEEERKEKEKELRNSRQVESAWMDKNRELLNRCNVMELEKNQQNLLIEQLKNQLEKTERTKEEYQELLNEYQQKIEKNKIILEERITAEKQSLLLSNASLDQELQTIKKKLSHLDEQRKEEIQEEIKKNEQKMEELHARVRKTIMKKDEIISALREELHIAEIRYQQTESLLEQQRREVLSFRS